MLMKLFVLIQLLMSASFAQAASAPPCLDNSGNPISVNNSQVILWKSTTMNQFLARAHVQGVVTDVYPDHSGHNHFAIDLDSNPKGGLEVVYNTSFGALPTIRVGMTVEACGDYITSDASTPQYPPSPMGAIIHWIHRNPSSQGHKSGFIMINGVLYGQGNGNGS